MLYALVHVLCSDPSSALHPARVLLSSTILHQLLHVVNGGQWFLRINMVSSTQVQFEV